jgi:hypothetical protein
MIDGTPILQLFSCKRDSSPKNLCNFTSGTSGLCSSTIYRTNLLYHQQYNLAMKPHGFIHDPKGFADSLSASISILLYNLLHYLKHGENVFISTFMNFLTFACGTYFFPELSNTFCFCILFSLVENSCTLSSFFAVLICSFLKNGPISSSWMEILTVSNL